MLRVGLSKVPSARGETLPNAACMRGKVLEFRCRDVCRALATTEAYGCCVQDLCTAVTVPDGIPKAPCKGNLENGTCAVHRPYERISLHASVTHAPAQILHSFELGTLTLHCAPLSIIPGCYATLLRVTHIAFER